MPLPKIEKIQTDKQKIIVTGLIVSDEFCDQIIPIFLKNRSLMGDIFSSFSKIVIGWCIEYFKEYKKAPKQYIQSIYENKQKDLDENLEELIHDFLFKLSNNYTRQDNFNEQYIIDQSIKYLRESSLRNLEKQIKICRKQGNLEDAEKLVNDFKEINKETKNYEMIDFFEDFDEIRDAIHKEEEVLFRMPGAVGDMVGDLLRGDVVSYIAPAKRGKSWWLWETAQVALLARLRVLYISFEMSKTHVIKRGCQSMLGEVKYNDDKLDKPIEVDIPYFEYDEEREKYIIQYRQRKKTGLNFGKVKSKIKALNKHVKSGALKILCAASESMTPKNISDAVDDMVLEGFVPDVIVSDYADLTLSPIKGEYRHKIDAIWKGYKNIALSKHCLVVTATHSNKSTYNSDIKQGDTSEDIRKNNHVSVLMSLDQTPYEKSKGIMRFGVMLHRHDDFNPEKKTIVLECKKIGRCYLDSKLSNEVYYKSVKEK